MAGPSCAILGSSIPPIRLRRAAGESIDRERSKLPHVTISPAPTDTLSQSLNDTVGCTV